MNTAKPNIDPDEVSKFEAMAARWWDTGGDFKPLHDLNPLRLDYIRTRADGLAGKTIADIGCGGGILSEAMAREGARVIGLDAAEGPLKVAQLHQLRSPGLQLEYRQQTAEDHAREQPGAYDIVTCMELLEHVPDPASLVQACRRLVREDGHVFFSTINRGLKAYLLAIVGAEYLLAMLPRGTHDYARFVRPAELARWLRQSGLTPRDIQGMTYSPLSRSYSLGRDTAVNYLVHARTD